MKTNIKHWVGGFLLLIILISVVIWLYIIQPVGLKIGNFSKNAFNSFIAPFRNVRELKKHNKSLKDEIYIATGINKRTFNIWRS
jgi:hypothetical protein